MNDYESKRKALGLSRKEVCDQIGMSYRTVQSWETGEKVPPPWVWNLVYAAMKKIKK